MINSYIYEMLLKFMTFNAEGISGVLNETFDENVLTDDFFECLKQYVDYMVDNECLNDYGKDNLLKLVNYIRFKNNKMQECNSIILKLNICKSTNYLDYAVDELELHDMMIELKDLDNIDNLLSYWVAYDMLVLYTHVFSLECEDADQSLLIGCVDYFRSIYYMSQNYPELFQIPGFKEKIKQTVQTNKQLITFSSDKMFKKLTKMYSKMISES